MSSHIIFHELAGLAWQEAHVMGEIMRSRYEVDHLLAHLADKFQGDSYDLVRRNCNHFANELYDASPSPPPPRPLSLSPCAFVCRNGT